MGFDAFFFARLDYQDKDKRMNDMETEWIWRPNMDTLGKDVNIFTHATQQHYSAPQGFNWEINAGDPEWINNKTSENFNAPERANALMAILDERVSHQRHNHLFTMFGDDFEYKSASANYQNMDAMIEWMNENHGDKYIFKYSTPSDYIDAIAALDIAWPTKYDDMFPYADNENSYWTGYFTSRPNHKGYIRTASHKYHASSQLFSDKALDQDATMEEIGAVMNANNEMLDRIGIVQHHDAITGTGKQRIADDYSAKIYTGLEINHQQYQQLITDRILKQTGLQADEWTQCLMSNQTFLDCPIGDKWRQGNNNFDMNFAVHNPASNILTQVSIPVPNGEYTVHQWNNGNWDYTRASLDCHNNNALQDLAVESCHIRAQVALNPREVALFKLHFRNTTGHSYGPLNKGDTIYSSDGETRLMFKNIDA
jgi:hypothetical protein